MQNDVSPKNYILYLFNLVWWKDLAIIKYYCLVKLSHTHRVAVQLEHCFSLSQDFFTVPESWIWLDRFSDPLYTILAVLLRIRFSASASPRNTYGVVLQNAREESPLICQPIKPFADKFRQELMWRPTILSPFKTKVQNWACLYMLISSAPATQVLLKIPYKNRKLSQNL